MLIYLSFFVLFYLSQFSGFRKSMLFLYILIVLGLVIAMVVIVVLAPIEAAYNSIKDQIMN